MVHSYRVEVMFGIVDRNSKLYLPNDLHISYPFHTWQYFTQNFTSVISRRMLRTGEEYIDLILYLDMFPTLLMKFDGKTI